MRGRRFRSRRRTGDDAAIGRLAAEHLLAKPLDHLAFFGPPTSAARRDVFTQEARRAGRDVEIINSEGLWGEALAERLRELPKHCGVFAFNDDLGSQIIRAARELDIPMPQDLAVVGCDDDSLINAFSAVSLTSIDPDFRRVGHEAARVLDAMLHGAPPPDEPIRIPPKGLIERNSSDFPREADELVVRAARMVRDRACKGLTVEQVADALPITYWTLNRRFKAAFGRSLRDEILHLRLAEARRLLATTRMSMSEIAERTGYGEANHFSASFRTHVGVSPSDYRRRNANNSHAARTGR